MSTARIAQAALGVMALHVADDSFLQPASGTSAADHVVSGLVPILVLALARLGLAARPARRRGRRWRRARPLRGGARRRGRLLLGCDRAVRRRLQRPRRGARRPRADRRERDRPLDLPAPHRLARLALVAARARRDRRRRGRLPAGRARPARLRRDPHHARRGPDGPPRRPVRGRDPPHRRRARPPRLVHPLAQRRRGHGLSGPGQGPEARAVPGPRGVRRPPGRPSRRGRQRGRPARLRLDVRRGHPGRRRIPPGPRRRGSRADRRPRPVRRRGDDAADRGGHTRPGRRGVRRRGRAGLQRGALRRSRR